VESVWSVLKLSTESVGSRRELVVNCVHTADADATKQFCRVGVGGVYWALAYKVHNSTHDTLAAPAEILAVHSATLFALCSAYCIK